jgi:type II secretory pathway component PulF
MGRRITKAESSLLLLLIAVAAPIFLITKFFETVGFVVPVIVIVGIIISIAVSRTAAKKHRVSYLLAKYGDQQTVDRIMSKTIWVGETSEQLIESLGNPADIDEKVLRTKTKAIWKYAHRGGARYGLRITVENGVVVGWDEKL